jgi:hypothetical protein
MPQLTTTIGILLVILGVIGYFASGMASWTAFIPSIIGVIFLLLGIWARSMASRKLAMHIAMGLALLLVLGMAGQAVPNLIKLAQGQELERPLALMSQVISSILLIVLLVFGIKSFIDARKAQTGNGGQTPEAS